MSPAAISLAPAVGTAEAVPCAPTAQSGRQEGSRLLRRAAMVTVSGLVLLSGCDMLGVESASAVAARREAEGKAIGAACRHAGRALEDCYAMNKRADKSAVFAGWREMNDYMRENSIETLPPQSDPPPARPARPASAPAAAKG